MFALAEDGIASVTLISVPELGTDSLFAGCRIQEVAGRGGMGIVYRATQLPLGRAVALKLVSPERAADPAFRARFERESRLAAAIDHPNVIPIYAAGEENGRLFIVMRWVRGHDLQALIARTGGLDPRRTAAIVAQVGAGLDAAHEAGIVHRDVKPANVLITGEEGSGHVYLSDFGLTREVTADTRITESGEWLGTVNFMAPEQFEGARVDSRTDVYGLGCLLYAALTGQAPYAGRTVAATMLAHLDEPPPKPSATEGVPAAFDAVVARAMAKLPDDRYASAGELVEATQAAAGAPGDQRPGAEARNGGGADQEPDSRRGGAGRDQDPAVDHQRRYRPDQQGQTMAAEKGPDRRRRRVGARLDGRRGSLRGRSARRRRPRRSGECRGRA